MKVDVSFVLRTLILSSVLLFAIHLFLWVVPISKPGFLEKLVVFLRPKFDLGGEGNIPAWFSSVLLFMISLPILVRGVYLKRMNSQSHWKIYHLMTAGFIFLSMDEAAQIHETLNNPFYFNIIKKYVFSLPSDRMRFIISVGLYSAGCIIVIVILRKDVLAVIRESAGRKSLFYGTTTYLAGALVVDNFTPDFHSSLEELLEMVGASLIFHGFLLKIKFITIQTDSAQDDKFAAIFSVAKDREFNLTKRQN